MNLLGIVVTAAAIATINCNGTPIEPSEVHGPEGQGGESGESGTQYAPSDTARETRNGVELILDYDSARQVFTGTVRNTTTATVTQVRVEIHLSNGVELGPTPRTNLAAQETQSIELDARGQTFTWFSVHVEIGSGSAQSHAALGTRERSDLRLVRCQATITPRVVVPQLISATERT